MIKHWGVLGLLGSSLMLASSPARAHFRLDQPASDVMQAANGDPQKPANNNDPCPAGTATGMVTQVRAGGLVRVRITETVAHGGHYRVSFAANRASFQFPATVATNDQCVSTTIAANPQLPVLADGLFVHNQTQANAQNFCNGTATCETDVTIPASTTPGSYTLQVIEWMLPHGSGANNGIYGCFYTHCANLQVVASDAGISDSGVVVVDSGAGGDSGGANDSGASTPDANAASDSGGSGGNTGGNRVNPTLADTGGDGCSVGASQGASLAVPGIAAIAALAMMRRRRHAR
jgi:MYXO-CTERM domain-containing protein